MSKPTVLVTSSTGRIGKELVALLAKGGQFIVRAAVNTPSKEGTLRALGMATSARLARTARARLTYAFEHTAGANEVVKLDLKDSATYSSALEGVTAVYSASLDPLLDGHMQFAKAMGKYKNLKHVVRVSG